MKLDYRADVIQACEFHRVRDPEDPRARIVDFRANAGVERQVNLLVGDSCEFIDVPADLRADFTHRLYFPHGCDRDFRALIDLLEHTLTLNSPSYTDFALALDWYKVPDDDAPPTAWRNTDIGELVFRSKYWKYTPDGRRAAHNALVKRLGDLITKHPILRDADFIVGAPGHLADGNSFSERLANDLAEFVDKPRVRAISNIGPWEPQKEGANQLDVESAFSLDDEVYGTVIVLDDVIRRGTTISATAHAATQSGADVVAGVAAVRTLRS